jgi:hypothetical protein
MKFLSNLHEYFTVLFFFGRQLVLSSRDSIFTCQSPKKRGEALDVVVRQIVQLRHHTNTGACGFWKAESVRQATC